MENKNKDLFQKFPVKGQKYSQRNGKWHIDRSHTKSKTTYNSLAYKELNILRENSRIAEYTIVVRLLEVFTKEKRSAIWSKAKEYLLKKHGISVYLKVEPTRSKIDKLRFQQSDPMDYEVKITNRVHVHILFGHIDPKEKLNFTEKELKTIFEDAFSLVLSPDQFKVDNPRKFENKNDYHKYLRYFTKHNMPRKVILFEGGMDEQLYFLTRSWFCDENGNQTGKEKLWEPCQERCKQWAQEQEKKQREQQQLISSDDIVPQIDANTVPQVPVTNHPNPFTIPQNESNWYWDYLFGASKPLEQPTDYTKLKTILDGEPISALYDWYLFLIGEPTLFNSILPSWIFEVNGQKRQDLLNELWWRLKCGGFYELPFLLNEQEWESVLGQATFANLFSYQAFLTENEMFIYNTILPSWIIRMRDSRRSCFESFNNVRNKLLDDLSKRIGTFLEYEAESNEFP